MRLMAGMSAFSTRGFMRPAAAATASSTLMPLFAHMSAVWVSAAVWFSMVCTAKGAPPASKSSSNWPEAWIRAGTGMGVVGLAARAWQRLRVSRVQLPKDGKGLLAWGWGSHPQRVPVLTWSQPFLAREPVSTLEPVLAGKPASTHEPVLACESVLACTPVLAAEPVLAGEPVLACAPVLACEPVLNHEPALACEF